MRSRPEAEAVSGSAVAEGLGEPGTRSRLARGVFSDGGVVAIVNVRRRPDLLGV